MNVWEILGIHATDETSEIRRAYANQLKTHHPEDDPEGFQRLREAYEQAFKYAKIRAMIAASKTADEEDELADGTCESENGTCEPADIGEDKKDESAMVDQRDPLSPAALLDESINQIPITDSQAGLNAFLKSAETLYADFYARIDIENWKTVLQAEQLWDMSLKEKIHWEVLRFFAVHSDLPQPVWCLLDSEFYWSKRCEYVPIAAGRDLNVLHLELDPYWNFDYTCFHNNESVDFELYSKYRRKVKRAILEGSQEAAAHYFKLASNLFAEDMKFFLVYHDYLHSIRGSDFFGPSLEERLQSVNEMIDLNPDNPLYLLQRAKLYMEQSNHEKAFDEYERLLQIYPDNLDILVQMTRAYKNMNRRFRELVFLIRVLIAAPIIKKRLARKLAETNDNHEVETQMRINEYTLRDFRDSEQYKELTWFYIFLAFVILLSVGVVFVNLYS